MMIFAFIAGILLLYGGSEALIKGGSSLALRWHIKPLVIGLTVIAISTSSPELAVSLRAAWTDHGDILVGDIVGSNIFNVAGILCICAMVHKLPLQKQVIKLDWPVMFLAYLMLTLFWMDGRISRWEGFFLVVLLILYVGTLFFVSKKDVFKESKTIEIMEKPLKSIYLDLCLIGGGWAALVYGGSLIVKSAIFFAKIFGVTEASIGLSLVAFGTSLPEISCSIVALLRKKYDLLVGNIIGSNIFNVFFVLGISVLISPIRVINIRYLDLSIMFLTGLLIIPYFQKNQAISRIWAFFLFLSYLIYLFFFLP